MTTVSTFRLLFCSSSVTLPKQKNRKKLQFSPSQTYLERLNNHGPVLYRIEARKVNHLRDLVRSRLRGGHVVLQCPAESNMGVYTVSRWRMAAVSESRKRNKARRSSCIKESLRSGESNRNSASGRIEQKRRTRQEIKNKMYSMRTKNGQPRISPEPRSWRTSKGTGVVRARWIMLEVKLRRVLA